MAPKQKQQTLWVKAVGLTRHIDPDTGKPLQDMSFVGRDANFDVIEDGVTVSYHPFYIKELKDGALIPMDKHTSQLAGVKFTA